MLARAKKFVARKGIRFRPVDVGDVLGLGAVTPRTAAPGGRRPDPGAAVKRIRGLSEEFTAAMRSGKRMDSHSGPNLSLGKWKKGRSMRMKCARQFIRR